MCRLFSAGIFAVMVSLCVSAQGAQSARRLSWIPFKGASLCSDGFPCFQVTPDARGVILLNPQHQLYHVDVDSGVPTRIGDGQCSNQDCFSVSQDSRSVAFTREEGDEMAVYLGALPGAPGFVSGSAPRKLGLLPRFAGTQPRKAEYELRFCGTSDTLFARAGVRGGIGGVHAFVTQGASSPRRDVFFEKGGKAGTLLCSPSEQSAYFLAHRFPEGGTHQEVVMKASAARLRKGVAAAEILFRQDSDPQDEMVGAVRAAADEFSFILRTPNWDQFPLSALFFKSGGDSAPRPLAQLTEARIEELLAWRGDSLIFSSQEKEGLALHAQPKGNGPRVRLTQSKFAFEQASLVTSGNHGRVLFMEGLLAERHLILADVKGASRRLLWTSPPNPPSTNPPPPEPVPPGPPTQPILGQGPAVNRSPLKARLMPSGKCALVISQALDGLGPHRAEVSQVDAGTVSDLLPSAQEYAKIGGFEMAPDSSFAVFIADKEQKGEHQLYLTPTPQCR